MKSFNIPIFVHRFLTVFTLGIIAFGFAPLVVVEPAPLLYLDPTYAPQLHGILDYLHECSPTSYALVLDKARYILIVPTQRMHSGEAHAWDMGMELSEYLFAQPELYFPPNESKRYIGALITHEARHLWQSSNWPALYAEYGISAIATRQLEDDANVWKAQVLSDCP